MIVDGKPPGLYELVIKGGFEHFGIFGFAVLFILALAFFFYNNYDKVKTWLDISSRSKLFTRWSLPQADPHRFSVLVAHLASDDERKYERLIFEALQEFEDIQVLSLDETFCHSGHPPDKVRSQEQERAWEWVKKTGADVLIGGIVHDNVVRRTIKPEGEVMIYWTANYENKRQAQLFYQPMADGQIEIRVKLSELLDMLLMLVASLRGKEGPYVADRLTPSLERWYGPLDNISSSLLTKWTGVHLPFHTSIPLAILADALLVRGEQSGQNQHLKMAIAAFRDNLKKTSREYDSGWAKAQNNLGIALLRLGERERDAARLDEAVAAFREALTAYEAVNFSFYIKQIRANLLYTEDLLNQVRN
jgi:tetratricopeptide (TPR) repeat protein